MIFSRNSNGSIVPGPGQQPAPLAQDQRGGQLERRLVALEQDHAKLVNAFRALVQKLAQRAQQPQLTASGALVPQVMLEQGQSREQPQQDDFDAEIDAEIAASGGDDDDNPFDGI